MMRVTGTSLPSNGASAFMPSHSARIRRFPDPASGIRNSPKLLAITGLLTALPLLPTKEILVSISLDIETKISLVGSSGSAVKRPVIANSFGEFLIPDAGSGNLRIRAECDGMKAEAPLEGKEVPVTLIIQDTRPSISAVFARR